MLKEQRIETRKRSKSRRPEDDENRLLCSRSAGYHGWNFGGQMMWSVIPSILILIDARVQRSRSSGGIYNTSNQLIHGSLA